MGGVASADETGADQGKTQPGHAQETVKGTPSTELGKLGGFMLNHFW
jgi:hypothetical protein